MKHCPNCGVEVEEGQKYCGECGTKLDFEPLPKEPVYTEDERLKNDPTLNAAAQEPMPRARRKREKVPELTLEPDLWGAGAAAAAQAEPETPAQKSDRAADALRAVEEQGPTVISEKTEDRDYERPDAEYHGPAQGSHGDYRAPRQNARRQNTRRQSAQRQTAPNTRTAAEPPHMSAEKMPDETLMLIWSIILTCLCSVCGIVGLVKTIKARKTMDLAAKYRLLSSAKIWLIVGTALHVLPMIAEIL